MKAPDVLAVDLQHAPSCPAIKHAHQTCPSNMARKGRFGGRFGGGYHQYSGLGWVCFLFRAARDLD